MRKATAIYNAPEGDSKVCEMGGHTFFDGKLEELNSEDDGHLIAKLQNNQHFDIEVGDDDGKKKRGPGRPSNAEKAAQAEAASKIPGPAPGEPAPGTAAQ